MSEREAGEAIKRLIELAKRKTDQSKCAANFLLAWWNGAAWGHFPLTDLFCVDKSVSTDMATVFLYLCAQNCGVYPDAWGHAEDMHELVGQWRGESKMEKIGDGSDQV